MPVEAMKAAVDELDPEVRAAIEESVRRSRAVSASQVPAPFHTDLAEGARVSERWIPVQRVGLYVPGGKAVYPSSVIMNVVPAQAAGVESLAIATPPSRNNADGLPDKTILATCAILGVDEVYAVGGAQAVAMFAYGAKDPNRRTAKSCAIRSTRSPVLVTSSSLPPSAWCPASSASTRGRTDRNRHHRRQGCQPELAGRRSDRSGRA